MLRWIVLLFVIVPLAELYLLLWLSTLIGFWPTVGIVVVTGLLGGTFAKREGLKVWREWKNALDELRPPQRGVIDGVLVLIGGVLLITPGVLTDATGLVLLIPYTRRKVAERIRRGLDRRVAEGRIQVMSVPFAGAELGDIPSDVIETSGEALPSADERVRR